MPRSSDSHPDVVLLKDDQHEIPEGWDVFVHLRGWLYFFNSSLKLVTDQDIRDPRLYELFSSQASKLTPSEWPEGMEVLFQVNKSGNIDYLLAVNHKHCTAVSQSIEDCFDEAIESLDIHALNRRRRLYWNYLWGHPSHAPCPSRALPDASDALNWYYTDNLVSGSRCNAPFSKVECEELMGVLKDMQR
ncbi:hypothetical protein AAF712_002099 [Marasmius tenuissimus]|uniref:Uncharacterized protein n=1 Tax=Marasmius tenuissimus TaxID=585030 RepID=A0ABR3AD11_9AGAR